MSPETPPLPLVPPHRDMAGTSSESQPNVAMRLRESVKRAKKLGFHVRMEALDGETPGWCAVGQKRIAFLDVTTTTAEQLSQLESILADFGRENAA